MSRFSVATLSTECECGYPRQSNAQVQAIMTWGATRQEAERMARRGGLDGISMLFYRLDQR